jgi:predicted transposase YbfD/YdcC
METHNYLCSLSADAACLARIIRRHWSAENSCHHGLDVTFQKDHYQVRDSNTAHSPPPQRALRKLPPPRSLFRTHFIATMTQPF